MWELGGLADDQIILVWRRGAGIGKLLAGGSVTTLLAEISSGRPSTLAAETCDVVGGNSASTAAGRGHRRLPLRARPDIPQVFGPGSHPEDP